MITILNLVFIGYQYYYSLLRWEIIAIVIYHLLRYRNLNHLIDDFIMLLFPWIPLIWSVILWIQYFSIPYFIENI